MKRRTILVVLFQLGFAILIAGSALAADRSPIPTGDQWPNIRNAKVIVVGENWWNFSILKDDKVGLIAARQTKVNEETKGETPNQGAIVVRGKAYGNITERLYRDALGKIEGFEGLQYRMIPDKELLDMFNGYISSAHLVSHGETLKTKVTIEKKPTAAKKKKKNKNHKKKKEPAIVIKMEKKQKK